MGNAQHNLIVPYKVAGREVKVEIAFSEEQWSWSRVRFYGGLARDDERRVDRDDPFTQDLNQCEQRRKKRFTTLNLKSLIEDKQSEVLDQKGAKHLFQEFDIYHCVIPAPTIPITRAINDILMLQQELIKVTENTQNPVHENHGSTTSLVYKYFFDEKSGLLSKQKNTKDIQSIESDRINSDNLISFSTGLQPSVAALNPHANRPTDVNQNDDIRTIIDLDKVKASLKIERRSRLRELIRITQSSLVSLLQQTHPPITDIKPSVVSGCDIDWYQCVKDYLCSNLNAYGKGFNFIGTLTNALAFEPSDIDTEMDLKRDIDANQPTAGHLFIVELIEEGSPLLHLLYPSEQDIADAKELPDIQKSETFKKNVPNYQLPEIEKFNIYFFKYISNNGLSVSKNISDLFNSIIKNIVSNYQESVERKLLSEGKDAIEKSIKKSVDLFKSHLDIIQNKLMPDFEIKYLSELVNEDVIIGTSHQQLKGQGKSVAEHQAITKQKSEIMHDDNGEILGAKVTKEFSHPQGAEVDETINFHEAQPLAKAHLENHLTKKKLNLSDKPKHDPLVITAKEEAYKSTSIFKKQPIHLMDIGSSSALLFLGLLNVKSKVDALKKEIKEDNSSSLQAKWEAIEASLSTSYLLTLRT